VLIVDDDRLLLKEYLLAADFEVTEAINGEDSMDFIQAKGLTGTKENYLAKPVSPEELLQKMRETLHKRIKAAS